LIRCASGFISRGWFFCGSRVRFRLSLFPLRAFGFGLKYSAGFGFTHLGRIGKAA